MYVDEGMMFDMLDVPYKEKDSDKVTDVEQKHGPNAEADHTGGGGSTRGIGTGRALKIVDSWADSDENEFREVYLTTVSDQP